MNPITQAELKIAAILQQLEIDTGEVVDRVELEDMEVTQIESVRSEFQRRVLIVTHRLPGTRWAT